MKFCLVGNAKFIFRNNLSPQVNMIEKRESFDRRNKYMMSLTTSRGFTNGLSNNVSWQSEKSKIKKRRKIATATALLVSITMIALGIVLLL